MARVGHATLENTVALLTPHARGAIASLTIDGPRAWEIVSRLFCPAHPRLNHSPPIADSPTSDRIRFGRWGSPAGEEVVVRCHSESRIEIHCHGGLAASAAIISALEGHGCRQLEWPQAYAACNENPLLTETRIALAAARTDRAARILLWQFGGALDRAFVDIGRHVVAGDLASALAAVQTLLASAPLGRHLVEPWRVVLAGPPNVGKSSLINALVGYARSIVFDMPGTTRDVVTATTAIGGWPVELSDTAGVGRGGESLERAGVELAREQLARADLVVLVFDFTKTWSPESQELLDAWPKSVVVYNKCDLTAADMDARPPGIRASALGGEGLPELEQRIAARLVPNSPAPGDAVPFTERQLAWLNRLLAALKRGEQTAVHEILGSVAQPRLPPARPEI